jgi:hypothetical protein
MTPRPVRHSFVRSLLAFAFSGRRLWMLPVVALLLLVSILALVGALAPYAAFLYPL